MINTPPIVVAAVTGHRQEKIPDFQFVEHQLMLAYHDLKVDKVIQGCANGADLLSAYVAFENDIPYVSVKPWAGHAPRTDDRVVYKNVIDRSESVVITNHSEKFPGNWCYQRRNEYMVDHSSGLLIAIWDGSVGGTNNCVKYAIKRGCDIWVIDPAEHRAGWYAQN